MSEAPFAGDDRPSILTVATLTRAHGVRGELKVRCEPDILEFLRAAAEHAVPLTLRLPERGDEYEVTLASVRGHESAPILAIDGVEDRTSAESYRGGLLCAPRELLPEPDEGEFFLADLRGCAVHDRASGRCIGRVQEAASLPANVVLTIDLLSGGTLLAPLVDDAVPVVDVEARRVDVDVDFLGLGSPDPELDA